MIPHVLAALVVIAVTGVAWGQDAYPSRPVRILVPFPPGGVTDITARPLAAARERAWQNPVVVANKAGAAGNVGRQAVAVAKPDGYTLMVDLVSISNGPAVDAPAFRQFWDQEARTVAAVIKRIGKVEKK